MYGQCHKDENDFFKNCHTPGLEAKKLDESHPNYVQAQKDLIDYCYEYFDGFQGTDFHRVYLWMKTNFSF